MNTQRYIVTLPVKFVIDAEGEQDAKEQALIELSRIIGNDTKRWIAWRGSKVKKSEI